MPELTPDQIERIAQALLRAPTFFELIRLVGGRVLAEEQFSHESLTTAEIQDIAEDEISRLIDSREWGTEGS